MNSEKLYVWLFLRVFAIVFCCSLLLTLVVSYQLDQLKLESERELMLRKGWYSIGKIQALKESEYQAFCRQFGQREPIRMAIVRKDGHVIADSEFGSYRLPQKNLNAIRDSFSGRQVYYTEVSKGNIIATVCIP